MIPANCFTRAELHSMVIRVGHLASSAGADPGLVEDLQRLAEAAAILAGRLADLAEDPKLAARHPRILDGKGWENSWPEFSRYTKQDRELLVLSCQLLRRQQRNGTRFIGTGRYRLQAPELGLDTVTSDTELIDRAIGRVLAAHDPAGAATLQSFFEGADHAVS